MSTGVTPVSPEQTSTANASPPSQAPATSTPSNSAPPASSSEWRAGADAPSWAQGKSPAEILNIATQLASVVKQQISAPQAPPVQQPYTNQWGSSQQAPQGNAPAPTFDNDGYITGAELGRQAPRMMQEYLAPQIQGVYDMAASGNLAHVRQNNAAIFQKYGPEVDAKLATVPKNLWTVDNLNQIVNFVRADHVEEIAREYAGRLVAEMEPNLRSTGSPSVPIASAEPTNTLKSEKIDADWKARADKAGLTEQAVDEFCRANDMDRATFFGQFEKTAITEVTRRG